MLAIASSGKVMKTTSARPTSSSSMITTTPIRVSRLENSVVTPVEISWSSASTSFVIREISTPGRLRVKNPIDIPCRWVKIRSRRSWSARWPTHPTR